MKCALADTRSATLCRPLYEWLDDGNCRYWPFERGRLTASGFLAECGSVGNGAAAGTARMLLPRLPPSVNPT